jgi:hypothetical protein
MSINTASLDNVMRKLHNYYSKVNDTADKLKLNSNISIALNNSKNPCECIIYRDNSFLLKCNVNIIGYYDNLKGVWKWGWDIDFIDRRLIKYITKLKYTIDTINVDKSNASIMSLFSYFDKPVFKCDEHTIQFIVKLLLFICECVWIIDIKKYIDNKHIRTDYIMIRKIMQYGN